MGAAIALGALLVMSASGPAAAQVPGPNVNMISIDQYLQKQNEVDLAISPRNPCHIVGAANDYRTVNNRGLNTDQEYGDSWVGMYVSTDCGATWLNYLVPGYIQGLAAADPMPRFGPGGALYLSHLTFARGTNFGTISVARYLDYNDIEGVPGPATGIEDTHNAAFSPVRYLGGTVFAQGSGGVFADKPSIAVAPGEGAACSVTPEGGGDPVTIPATNVYVAWTEFVGNSASSVRSKVYFARSTDCGRSLAGPATKLSEGIPVNQGTVIAVNPNDPKQLVVAWRQVRQGNTRNTILFARSADGGRSFTKASPVGYLDGITSFSHSGVEVKFEPYDQPTTPTTFRTIGYPTMAWADNGRLYLAVSARVGEIQAGRLPHAPDTTVQLRESRVLVTSTTDGVTWQPPEAVDAGLAADKGQQIMPALAYAAGRLNLIWYDLRDDKATIFKPFVDEKDAEDSPDPYQNRHTLDVRGAQASIDPAGGPALTWNTYGIAQGAPGALDKISQYLFGINPPEPPGDLENKQRNFNRPNLKLYAGGELPFIGDYIGSAGLQYLPGAAPGQWAFNGMPTAATPPDGVRLSFQTAWTDNRDAIVGEAGDTPTTNPNVDYTASGEPACDPNKTNSRNANVYTSRVTPGLYISILGNTKPTDIQRAFAIQVENGTNQDMAGVALSVVPDAGVTASFEQFAADPDLTFDIGRMSSVAKTVYVEPKEGTLYPRVRVEAVHGSQRAVAYINADPQNPPVQQPGNTSDEIGTKDTHNPRVENPRVENHGPETPRVENPRVENPRVENEGVKNPRVENAGVKNPRVENPRVENPRVENQNYENAPYSDVTYDVTNLGNTTSAFDLRVRLPVSGSYAFQLFGWRSYLIPVDRDCARGFEPVPQDVFNVRTGVGDQTLREATAAVRPGETIKLTLRAYYTPTDTSGFKPFCRQPGEDTPADVPSCLDVVQVTAAAQAANTGERSPKVSVYPLSPPDLTLGGAGFDITNPTPTVGAGAPFVAVVPGDTITVSGVTLANIGGVAVPAGFDYRYFVSAYSEEFPTPYAFHVSASQPEVAPGGSRSIPPTALTIPVGNLGALPSGTYRLGIQVDGGGVVNESNEQNNEVLASSLVQVVDPIAITTELPAASILEGSPSPQVTFAAQGGVGTINWQATGLPSGITLSSNGVLSGTPAAGTANGSCSGTPYSFTVTATDSSPLRVDAPALHTATRTYQLNVNVLCDPSGNVR